ncbi:MAG TPA: NAD(P)/FAD-dependent oxidoreductase, partial [Candidatus Baltobacteraceae bacterium]|nr:NAD(P)/FAD-dependent oxidoreductase [Candidatus Baltobacteraceae bacterium]
MMSSAIGVALQAAGHAVGWPIPEGGSGRLTQALAAYFKSIGGELVTDFLLENLTQLPERSSIFFDLTPRQIFKIVGSKLSPNLRKTFRKYPLGCGVFKMDWALREPIPWKNRECALAATVHIGGTADDILESEFKVKKGEHVQRPFIILSQPTLFDGSRAPRGQHIAWAYCHVPNGSSADMSSQIENQIERFAPGFRETILKRSCLFPRDLEARNPNIIGGDIFGGHPDQLLFRPTLSLNPYSLNPYSFTDRRLWICSSSTPPGPAVHGMCGYNAALAALKVIAR